MFYVDRSRLIGGGWDIMMSSPEPVTINSITGPNGAYPGNGGNPEFTGLPGMQARIRYKDQELECYIWDKVPENPADQNSFTRPGWRLVSKSEWPSEASEAGSIFSQMSVSLPQVIIEVGAPAPYKEKQSI